MPDQRLMNYFKFDEADLQSNRNGQFTEKQLAALSEDSKYNRLFSLIGVLFLFGIAAGGVYLSVTATSQAQTTQEKLTDILLAISVGGLCGGIGVRNLLRALKSFQVEIQKVEGPAKVVSRPFKIGDPNLVYELHVGGKVFRVTSLLESIMKEGDVYALYFTEGSENNLLSAERISQSQVEQQKS